MFNDKKEFKSKEELEEVFKKLDLKKEDKVICSCG
jgi:3-mercaptopyruvate sulfurtransferase SseA